MLCFEEVPGKTTKKTRGNKGETWKKTKERLFGMKTGARRGVLRESQRERASQLTLPCYTVARQSHSHPPPTPLG